jgi:hypothetical protein
MVTLQTAAFVQSMKGAKKALARFVIDALKVSSQRAAEYAINSGLFRHRTGALRKSIRPKMVSNFHAKTIAGAKHAAWVEHGNTFRTGAQWIYPKRGKFLKFTLDGTKFVVRRVRASKPRNYMAEAARKTEPLFERLCIDAVNRMFG